MSVYVEKYLMPEHRTQFAFKGKREHSAKETHQILRIQTNALKLKYHMVEKIVQLCQIP